MTPRLDKVNTRILENSSSLGETGSNQREQDDRQRKKNFKTIRMQLTDGQNPVANKNYMSIAVSVLTTSRVARNNGGAARQENRPQSATAYSSVR